MNYEERRKQKLFESYLKSRKKVQKLLLRKTEIYEQERVIAEYIRRLYHKQQIIEEKLKIIEAIGANEDLSRWTTKEIQVMKKDQDQEFYIA